MTPPPDPRMPRIKILKVNVIEDAARRVDPIPQITARVYHAEGSITYARTVPPHATAPQTNPGAWASADEPTGYAPRELAARIDAALAVWRARV